MVLIVGQSEISTCKVNRLFHQLMYEKSNFDFLAL